MTAQSVTLNIPTAMYERLRRRADESHRSIEEETLCSLAAGMPSNELPDALQAQLDALEALDDAELWNVASRKAPIEVSEELELLNRDRRLHALTPEKSQRFSDLIEGLETNMLMRARAAVILKQRGHDIEILRRS